MGRVLECDNTDDYDSGETGDTALQSTRSPCPTRAHHPPATPLSGTPGFRHTHPTGYGATKTADVEVVMNSSKSCDADIARL